MPPPLLQTKTDSTGTAQASRDSVSALVAEEFLHKLRNSLNAMRTHVALAQKQARIAPEKLPCQLEKLEQTIVAAERVLSDVETLAHPCSEDWGEADLLRLLREVLAQSAPHLESGRIRVEDRLTVELPPVKGPVSQLKQALLRLVTNALEAMPEGGTLTLAGCSGRDCIVLEVGDTGCGIDEPDRQRVFQPFFSRKPGRVGVSLALVKHTVESLGGSIEFNSEPGQGSIFRLILPAARGTSCIAGAPPDFAAIGSGVTVHGE